MAFADELHVGEVYDVATLELVGWVGDADDNTYSYLDYFGRDGRYLGPDQDGVYPILRRRAESGAALEQD